MPERKVVRGKEVLFITFGEVDAIPNVMEARCKELCPFYVPSPENECPPDACQGGYFVTPTALITLKLTGKTS